MLNHALPPPWQTFNQPPRPSFLPPIKADQPPRRSLPPCPIATIHSHHLRLRAQIAIEPAAPPGAHPPRFPALALFRRRPTACVDSLGIPASENLHRSRHHQGDWLEALLASIQRGEVGG